MFLEKRFSSKLIINLESNTNSSKIEKADYKLLNQNISFKSKTEKLIALSNKNFANENSKLTINETFKKHKDSAETQNTTIRKIGNHFNLDSSHNDIFRGKQNLVFL